MALRKEDLGSSLYNAIEEASFFLHRVWIHVLGSKYHPCVKQFSYLPEDIEVLADREHLDDWSELLRKEKEAVSNRRHREVHFIILAKKVDDPKAVQTYQLTFTVQLRADAPAMELRAAYLVDAKITNVDTGEQKELPIFLTVGDCMNDRVFPEQGGPSRFERARAYFA